MKKVFLVLFLVFFDACLLNAVPIKCTDNRMCKTWNKKGFCHSSFYSAYTKVTNCPVECGYCRSKPPVTRRPVTRRTRKPVLTTTAAPIDNEVPYDVFEYHLNTSADPCDDFFQFTCGAYQAKRSTENKEAGRLIIDIQYNISKAITDIIFDSTAPASPLVAIQKMVTYRSKCMDLAALNDESTNVRTQEFQDNVADVIPQIPMLHTPPGPLPGFVLSTTLFNLGRFYTGQSEPFFKTSVQRFSDGQYNIIMEAGDLMLKNIANYLAPEAESKRQAFRDYLFEITSYFVSDLPAGMRQPMSAIKAAINTAVDFEIGFAQIATAVPPLPASPILRETVLEPKTVAEVKALITNINYEDIFQNAAVTPLYPPEIRQHLLDSQTIYIYNTALFTGIDNYIGTIGPEIIGNYIFLRMLHQSVPYLDSRFAEAGNRLAQKVDGVPYKSSRKEDCFDQVNRHFAMSVDYMFVEKYFDLETKNKVDQLAENVRSELKEMFIEDKWLADETRKKAIDKLSKMRKHIGGPPVALDEKLLEEYYKGIVFNNGDSYRTMSVNVMSHARWRNMMQLVIPDYDYFTDPENFRATVANAFYLPDSNSMMIPVGLTFLANFSMPISTVYGGLWLVGHEFSHGFDTIGAFFDNNGVVGDWWDPETRKEFERRTECIKNQYSNVDIPETGLKVNGELTLAEDVADNAGVRAVFRAYKKYLASNNDTHVPGYKNFTNEQTFFISAGVAFCNWQPVELRKIAAATDTHAPNFARINTQFANYPEFAKAFQCKEGTKMNPTSKCEVY